MDSESPPRCAALALARARATVLAVPAAPRPSPQAPEPVAPPAGEPVRTWWVRFFFGRDAVLQRDPLRVLGLVALGIYFENYDLGLVNSALFQIARDLGIAPGETGFYLGAIRIGGLGTVLLIPFADRVGRRLVFLGTLVGMSLGTFATAFAQTPFQFAAIQMVTRCFMLTGAALSVVILVEEFPAEHRGAGLGLLAVLGGAGYGLGAILFAAIDVLPFGWRFLYVVGAVPLVLLPFFRRALRETTRFEAHRLARGRAGSQGVAAGWIDPIRALLRGHPRRVAAIGLAGMFAAMGSIAVFQYTAYFLQFERGWIPGQVTLMVIGAGVLGMFGNLAGGRGSDRFGRRRVGAVCLALAPCFALLFFYGSGAGTVLGWGLFVFCMAGGDLVVKAFSAEAFPTSHRGTSSGWLVAVQTVGWTVGLFAVGVATDGIEDLAGAVTGVSLTALVAAACVLLMPETGQRELEAISEEPGEG